MDEVRSYWENFRQMYGLRDELVAAMEHGANHDICIKRAEMRRLGKRVRLGIVKPKNDDDRIYKMEVRMDKDGTYEEYFRGGWEEMRRRLSGLGGVLYADPTVANKKENIIVLKFMVEKGMVADEYKRIFEAYQEFKKIIADYFPLEG